MKWTGTMGHARNGVTIGVVDRCDNWRGEWVWELMWWTGETIGVVNGCENWHGVQTGVTIGVVNRFGVMNGCTNCRGKRYEWRVEQCVINVLWQMFLFQTLFSVSNIPAGIKENSRLHGASTEEKFFNHANKIKSWFIWWVCQPVEGDTGTWNVH